MKQFCINWQLPNNFFFIVIRRFSLVKAAMNVLRILKCAMVLTKCLNFLIQVRNEYSPQPSKLLYNCQFKNKEALQRALRGWGTGGFF
jgi:hypothetical protein